MGDLARDTEVEGGDGRYRAALSKDWEIWGPCGGYVAAVMLRAAGAHSSFERPASLSCHFHGAAVFGEVDLAVETVRAGRRSESMRVSMIQGDRPVCEALVWTVADDLDGFAYDWTSAPDVPPPSEAPTIQELFPERASPYPFWENLEYRPLGWMSEEEFLANRPHRPEFRSWFRYLPTATFDDPFVEAGRVTVLADIMGWPAAGRALSADDDGRWVAPNIDLSVVFHQPPAGSEHLFLDAEASLATQGMVGATCRVWSVDGRLLGSAVQQMVCRPVPQEG